MADRSSGTDLDLRCSYRLANIAFDRFVTGNATEQYRVTWNHPIRGFAFLNKDLGPVLI